MATAKYLTDPPPQHRSHQLEKKKKGNWKKTQTRLVSGLMEGSTMLDQMTTGCQGDRSKILRKFNM